MVLTGWNTCVNTFDKSPGPENWASQSTPTFVGASPLIGNGDCPLVRPVILVSSILILIKIHNSNEYRRQVPNCTNKLSARRRHLLLVHQRPTSPAEQPREREIPQSSSSSVGSCADGDTKRGA